MSFNNTWLYVSNNGCKQQDTEHNVGPKLGIYFNRSVTPTNNLRNQLTNDPWAAHKTIW